MDVDDGWINHCHGLLLAEGQRTMWLDRVDTDADGRLVVDVVKECCQGVGQYNMLHDADG